MSAQLALLMSLEFDTDIKLRSLLDKSFSTPVEAIFNTRWHESSLVDVFIQILAFAERKQLTRSLLLTAISLASGGKDLTNCAIGYFRLTNNVNFGDQGTEGRSKWEAICADDKREHIELGSAAIQIILSPSVAEKALIRNAIYDRYQPLQPIFRWTFTSIDSNADSFFEFLKALVVWAGGKESDNKSILPSLATVVLRAFHPVLVLEDVNDELVQQSLSQWLCPAAEGATDCARVFLFSTGLHVAAERKLKAGALTAKHVTSPDNLQLIEMNRDELFATCCMLYALDEKSSLSTLVLLATDAMFENVVPHFQCDEDELHKRIKRLLQYGLAVAAKTEYGVTIILVESAAAKTVQTLGAPGSHALKSRLHLVLLRALRIRKTTAIPIGSAQGHGSIRVKNEFSLLTGIADAFGTLLERFACRWQLWAYYLVQGDLSNSTRVVDAAEELLLKSGTESEEGFAMLAELEHMKGANAVHAGQMRTAKLRFHKAYEYCSKTSWDELPRPWYIATSLNIRLESLPVSCVQGLAPDLLKIDGDNLLRIVPINEPFALAKACLYFGWSLLENFESGVIRDSAKAILSSANQIAREHGFAMWESLSRASLSRHEMLDPGATKSGQQFRDLLLEELLQAVSDYQQSGGHTNMAMLYSWLAEAAESGGRKTLAVDYCNYALALCRSGDTFYFPEVLRVSSRILSDPELLRQASDIARSEHCDLWCRRCLADSELER